MQSLSIHLSLVQLRLKGVKKHCRTRDLRFRGTSREYSESRREVCGGKSQNFLYEYRKVTIRLSWKAKLKASHVQLETRRHNIHNERAICPFCPLTATKSHLIRSGQ